MILYNAEKNGVLYYSLEPFFIDNQVINNCKILVGNSRYPEGFWLDSIHGIGRFDGTFEEGLEWLLNKN